MITIGEIDRKGKSLKESREWQGWSEGRESTRWIGSIRDLRRKIPKFEQDAFGCGNGVNKYKTLIVRIPLRESGVDLGYDEAMTSERIPIAAFSNNYRGTTFRGKQQGYKLVNHCKLLNDILSAIKDCESCEATLELSIYGARMYIDFLVPHYEKDGYTLKVTCLNSVDGKFALIINLFLHRAEDAKDIPFYSFHHNHTRELKDHEVNYFLDTALRKFKSGTWLEDEVDREIINNFINTKGFTEEEQQAVQGRLTNRNRVNLLRFREILLMLVDEGEDIFQDSNLTRFVKLIIELNKLADKTLFD